MTDILLDRIAGAVAGMVLGDALGVPGELWPREKVRGRFGWISEFLDGPEDNAVACYFKAGRYTDDSAQAFVVLRALMKAGTVPPQKVLADDLLEWVRSMNGFEINLLGPSSKASLLAWSKGEDAESVTKLSLTNGAAMRITPVGALVPADQMEMLVETVARVSRTTHSTDVAISGAAMVAQAVSSAIAGRDWREIREDVESAYKLAMPKGEPTWAASVLARLKAFEAMLPTLGESPKADDVSLLIYEALGTGTMTSESVAAALAAAFWCRDPWEAAVMCANMGGDTDTMGAMACAICGAKVGLSGMPADKIEYLEKVNGLDFRVLAQEILAARESFTL